MKCQELARVAVKRGGKFVAMLVVSCQMAFSVRADLPVSISASFNAAVKANTSGYASPVVTDWMSVAVGKTTSVPGGLTSIGKYTVVANKMVGWRNNDTTLVKWQTLPAVYANVSGTDAKVYDTEATPTQADEIWLHPGGFGIGAMLRFTVREASVGATAMRFVVTDRNVGLGSGVRCSVVVNGVLSSVAEMDDGGAATFVQRFAPLKVGDIVDFVVNSHFIDPASGKPGTNSDSTSLGVTLCEVTDRAYGGTLSGTVLTQTVRSDEFADYDGDVSVNGQTVLVIPEGATVPADPAEPNGAVFTLTNGATLKVGKDWTSGATRNWDFGSSGRPIIYIEEGKTLCIEGEVSGSCGLSKRGMGTLVLTTPRGETLTLSGEDEILDDWTLRPTDRRMLQTLLDKRGEVTFPDGEYELDAPLVIYSDTTLRCSQNVKLRLENGANSPILVNEHYLAGTDGDITILGGVWDGNNVNQDRASYSHVPPQLNFGQFIMLSGVTNLTIQGLTIKDPNGFSIQLTDVEHFQVEDIFLDCNCRTKNQDGVHVNGFARYGVIRHIWGQNDDDMVALNCDEGDFRSTNCDICDVIVEDVNGGEAGYTAVRLLSRDAMISNVTVRNISGRFQHYAVSFTHWAKDEYVAGMGHYHDVVLSNITATASATTKNYQTSKGMIWIQDGVSDISNLTFVDCNRVDPPSYDNTHPFVYVGKNVQIGSLRMCNVFQSVYCGQAILQVEQNARIGRLELTDVCQTVSGQQERLQIDSTATIDEFVDTSTPVVDSVRGWGPVVRPPRVPALKAETNDLAEALRTWLDTRANPVVTSGGTWEFARAGGEKLGYYYDKGNGIKGVQYDELGKPETYPKLYVNTSKSDAPAEDSNAKPLSPGELFMHPGSVDEHNLKITFTPTESRVFSVIGQVRAVNTAWGDIGNGVVFSGSVGSKVFSVETTKDCAAHAFSTSGVALDENTPLVLLLDRHGDYRYDATGAKLTVLFEGRPSYRPPSYCSASVSSNVNELARKTRGRYPDEFVVNGLGVSFGRTSALDGTMESLGRVVPDSAFVGWRNGWDSSSGRTPETYRAPDALLNVSGHEVTSDTTYNATVRADEWMLHPGLGRYSVIRFKPCKGFRSGDYALAFRLRDLLVSSSGKSKGVEYFFIRNGAQMGDGVLVDGTEAEVVAEVPDFAKGDVFDLVIRSTRDGGLNVDNDLTAVSVELRRVVKNGLAVFVR